MGEKLTRWINIVMRAYFGHFKERLYINYFHGCFEMSDNIVLHVLHYINCGKTRTSTEFHKDNFFSIELWIILFLLSKHMQTDMDEKPSKIGTLRLFI